MSGRVRQDPITPESLEVRLCRDQCCRGRHSVPCAPRIRGHRGPGPILSACALVGDAGGWDRRKTVLAACLAAAAALAAPAVTLRLPWLGGAGGGVAGGDAGAAVAWSGWVGRGRRGWGSEFGDQHRAGPAGEHA